MIYRIVVDGNDIYDTTDELSLISPSVKMSLNEAGSAEFTMPATHSYYDSVSMLTSDVDIYELDELIWFGRIIEQEISMNRDKKIQCEGAFAFFNDSIQRPRSFSETKLSEIITNILEAHNSQVPVNRQVLLGVFEITDIEISMSIDFSTTKDVLSSVIDQIGAIFKFRKVSGIIYMDFVSDIPLGTQPVQYGLNIVDITKSMNGALIYTSILPVGKEIDGEKVTIADENNGLDYIDSEYISIYGRITKYMEFSDIGTASELMTAAQKWLTENTPNALTVSCNAAELHYLNGEYAPFRTGQYVQVTSTQHGINTTLPLVSVDISMDSAVKQVTIGVQDNRAISKITA